MPTNKPALLPNFSCPKADDEAEQIYQAYPRKVAKPVALQKIRKALKTMEFSELLARTMAFARSQKGADMKFCPHPSTWFNQERYRDDPATWGSRPGAINDVREQIDVPITRA